MNIANIYNYGQQLIKQPFMFQYNSHHTNNTINNTHSNIINIPTIITNNNPNMNNNDNNNSGKPQKGHKKRKQRIVKNADVEIDDVFESPGYQYLNWIRITKQKLKVSQYRFPH